MLIAILVFCISAFATSSLLGAGEPVKENLQLEVNSSREIVSVNFNNQSFDVLLENSPEAAFYLDRDQDGSADRKFKLKSDGDIHRTAKILDFRENIYSIQISYQDEPEETGDAWMKIESIRLLK